MTQVLGMPFFMEQDKPFDPGDIRFFGSNGIVLPSNEGSHLIQQLDRGLFIHLPTIFTIFRYQSLFGIEKISEGSSINHSRLAATPDSAV